MTPLLRMSGEAQQTAKQPWWSLSGVQQKIIQRIQVRVVIFHTINSPRTVQGNGTNHTDLS